MSYALPALARTRRADKAFSKRLTRSGAGKLLFETQGSKIISPCVSDLLEKSCAVNQQADNASVTLQRSYFGVDRSRAGRQLLSLGSQKLAFPAPLRLSLRQSTASARPTIGAMHA